MIHSDRSHPRYPLLVSLADYIEINWERTFIQAVTGGNGDAADKKSRGKDKSNKVQGENRSRSRKRKVDQTASTAVVCVFSIIATVVI